MLLRAYHQKSWEFGPIVAIPKVLKQLNLSIDEMDWIELNEAFAAQALAVVKN